MKMVAILMTIVIAASSYHIPAVSEKDTIVVSEKKDTIVVSESNTSVIPEKDTIVVSKKTQNDTEADEKDEAKIYYFESFGGNGNGTTDNSAAFKKVVTEFNNEIINLILTEGTYQVDHATELPGNINVVFRKGAKLSLKKWSTFTIQGKIIAGQYQIFSSDDEICGKVCDYPIYPQWWGAKGDGVNDDSTAFQSAFYFLGTLQNRGQLYIPDGTYYLKSVFIYKGVSIRGESRNTILKAHETCGLEDSIFCFRNAESVYIEGITFDGNKPIVQGSDLMGPPNLVLYQCKDVNIENNIFQHNYSDGIGLQGSDNIVIRNNQFIDLDCGVCLMDYPSNNITVDQNYFDGAKKSEPISIYGTKPGYHNNITITNNTIKNHTEGSGILLRAVKNVSIKNNVINNCATGIYCTSISYDGTEYGVYNANIKNNTIKNSVYEGILIDNMNDSEVIGNTIDSSGTFSISTKKVINSKFFDNVIIANSVSDVSGTCSSMFFGMSDSIVSRNKFELKTGSKNYKAFCEIGTESNITYNNVFSHNITSVSKFPLFIIYSEDSYNEFESNQGEIVYK